MSDFWMSVREGAERVVSGVASDPNDAAWQLEDEGLIEQDAIPAVEAEIAKQVKEHLG